MSKKICKLCQSLEDYELKDNYHLYIYSDHEYTLAQIKSMTQDLNNKILQSHDSNEVVELRLSGQEIGNLGSKLFKKLSARELSDTKAFLAEREMSPIAVATSMSHITSLYKIISIKESRWLSNILKKQSLMSFF